MDDHPFWATDCMRRGHRHGGDSKTNVISGISMGASRCKM